MNYLLTGATGLLGASLLKNLVKQNNKITCLIHQKQNKNVPTKSRDPDQSIGKKLNIISGDLSNYPSLVRASQYADIIIHSAAVINEKKSHPYYLINYQGTKNLLRAALQNRVKLFVYISSWAVNPKAGDYSNSKFLAEKEVRNFPNYLIIRPADIYSMKQGYLLGLISLIKKVPIIPIIGDGNYLVSPLYVEDLSKSIVNLLKNGYKNNISTIVGPKIYTFNKIVKVILRALRIRKLTIHLPKTLIYPLIYCCDKLDLNFPLSIEKFRRLTTPKVLKNTLDFSKVGIKPVFFEEILGDLLLRI